MRITKTAQQWALSLLLLCTITSAITITKGKSHVPKEISSSEDSKFESSLISTELMKRSENVSESKSDKNVKETDPGAKEDSPSSIDVIPPTELGDDNRFDKADKNPRIYYGDTSSSRYPHGQGEEADFENSVPEGKSEYYEKPKGKVYFPKNYLSSKYSHSPEQKNGYKAQGSSGKRMPDHADFGEEHHHGHEFPAGRDHSHPHNSGQQGHEEHEHDEHHSFDHGHPGNEEPHGKEHHHVSGYGFNHGSFRHTIGNKVDAVGKALQVLIPSALLLTGVSALFPNRVHVPTQPINHRLKRAAAFYRRRSAISQPPPMPEVYDDIPSHILHAEHRIMDGSPPELYPASTEEATFVSSENPGFNPFKVFKGPGESATAVKTMQASIHMPSFPHIPDMAAMNEKNNYFFHGPEVSGEEIPPTPYGPGSDVVPPTDRSPEVPTTQISSENPSPVDSDGYGDRVKKPGKRRTTQRRRKVTRKPAVFLKESHDHKRLVQDSSESQTSRSAYPSNNTPGNNNHIEEVRPNIKAEQEFMSSLHNLVTPDVAKAIIENKQEPPRDVDLSPDGPVMGLLNSYAQHEHEPPACQKRALCELAVKGKSNHASKFEAFLWSVATLVPDVFSEMYDLQEVFQAIRDERCVRFECANPNLDLQMK